MLDARRLAEHFLVALHEFGHRHLAQLLDLDPDVIAHADLLAGSAPSPFTGWSHRASALAEVARAFWRSESSRAYPRARSSASWSTRSDSVICSGSLHVIT